MSLQTTRQKVLSLFKQLHRTSQVVFNEDTVARTAAHGKINGEFRKHTQLQDAEKVEQLLKVAEDAEKALREMVVQAKLNQETGMYEVKITKDTAVKDNTLFDPNANLPKRGRRKKCDEKPS